MSVIWVVPVLALVLGGVAVAALVRAAASDARDLAREVARFGELQTSIAGLRTEIIRARTSAHALRGR